MTDRGPSAPAGQISTTTTTHGPDALIAICAVFFTRRPGIARAWGEVVIDSCRPPVEPFANRCQEYE